VEEDPIEEFSSEQSKELSTEEVPDRHGYDDSDMLNSEESSELSTHVTINEDELPSEQFDANSLLTKAAMENFNIQRNDGEDESERKRAKRKKEDYDRADYMPLRPDAKEITPSQSTYTTPYRVSNVTNAKLTNATNSSKL
jgi:hypothetical protein